MGFICCGRSKKGKGINWMPKVEYTRLSDRLLVALLGRARISYPCIDLSFARALSIRTVVPATDLASYWYTCAGGPYRAALSAASPAWPRVSFAPWAAETTRGHGRAAWVACAPTRRRGLLANAAREQRRGSAATGGYGRRHPLLAMFTRRLHASQFTSRAIEAFASDVSNNDT